MKDNQINLKLRAVLRQMSTKDQLLYGLWITKKYFKSFKLHYPEEKKAESMLKAITKAILYPSKEQLQNAFFISKEADNIAIQGYPEAFQNLYNQGYAILANLACMVDYTFITDTHNIDFLIELASKKVSLSIILKKGLKMLKKRGLK